jgi:hypothetical protein
MQKCFITGGTCDERGEDVKIDLMKDMSWKDTSKFTHEQYEKELKFFNSAKEAYEFIDKATFNDFNGMDTPKEYMYVVGFE